MRGRSVPDDRTAAAESRMLRATLIIKIGVLLLVCAGFPSPSAFASSWPADPTQNLPVAAIPIDHLAPKAATDGSGGAVFVWEDWRFGTTQDANIYAQRVSSQGNVLWSTDGVPVCDSPGAQVSPQIVHDGVSGAIAVWVDYRNGAADVFAQRIGGTAGVVMWDSNGVAVCTAGGDQTEVRAVADGSGGAVITWRDSRGISADIYCQRIDATGNVVWAPDGVVVCSQAADQLLPELTSDATGGAIVVWRDLRNANENIYAARIDGTGTVPWVHDGVSITTATSQNRMHQIAPDDSGGAIVVWAWKSGISDVFAQRVNSAGSPLWTINGVSVSSADNEQAWPRIIPDGNSGAIVCWSDGRDDVSDVYANRLDAGGNTLWAVDGVPVAQAANTQANPRLVTDGTGGVIIAWEDTRNIQFDVDVYAQRLSSSGDTLWSPNGVPVSVAADWQSMIEMVSAPSASAIMVWQDTRPTNSEIHVYSQQLGPDGSLGNVATGVPHSGTPPVSFARAYPNPFEKGTIIEYVLEQPSTVSVTVFDVLGRRVLEIASLTQPPGRHLVRWDGRDDQGRKVPSGVYFYRLDSGGNSLTKKIVIVR